MDIELSRMIHPSWIPALTPQIPTIAALAERAAAEPAFLPPGPAVMRAFRLPLEKVRVLVVGQDPYPTPGHAVGLSFSVAADVRPLPKSLQNIYTELADDLGITAPEHGDLTGWFEQGVMLLNRVLTVAPGQPASHRDRGWEEVSSAAIAALAARGGPLVAVLWGGQARTLEPVLSAASVPCITSPHPSPLSAYRGFFNSKPFSRTNELLAAQGAAPIDWSHLPTPATTA